MAKTSVYLPDDLAEQARAYGIPISEVTQAAVRWAVRDVQLKGAVLNDISAVAERLNETRRWAAQKSKEQELRARVQGSEWARALATATDLEYVATFARPGNYSIPLSLLSIMHERTGPWANTPVAPRDERWEHFQAGAREIWDAVQPLLVEVDELGSITEPESGS
jgi:hypothetical protein